MKRLYARLVLWLIRPALEIRAAEEEAAANAEHWEIIRRRELRLRALVEASPLSIVETRGCRGPSR